MDSAPAEELPEYMYPQQPIGGTRFKGPGLALCSREETQL